MKKNFIKNIFENTYLFLIFLFLYFPIVILMIFSFNSVKSTSNWEGFSLRWYEQMFTDDNLLEAVFNTLSIGVVSSVIACIIGTCAAIGIQGYRSRKLKGVINAVTNLPMISSEIVLGVSLMMMFLASKIQLGYFTLLVSHITLNLFLSISWF